MVSAKKTVVVGLSGGVDSSVSALLLKKQGFDVIGLFMKNWDEKDEKGACLSSKDYADAARVAEQIGIPYFSVNFVQEYWDDVFTSFLSDLKQGYTPNPDILCNREIKFKALLEKARSLGGDFLATGHYCQISPDGKLLKGKDPLKDQSYFLYTLKESLLKTILFPIGHLPKKEVRKIAKEAGLVTSEKKDSTGICFIGKRNFKNFVGGHLGFQEGNFENLKGEIIGKHAGVAYYTIGQRKGLAIGGPGEAWFVVGKDPARNVVIIEQGADHPALYQSTLYATDLTWVSEPPTVPLACTAKIRYRQNDAACLIEKIENDRALVTFSKPQRAVTPRQSIVFYDGNICLGGGLIAPS